MNGTPFLPGFDPAQIWPVDSYKALLESVRSGGAVALVGVPGSAFAAAVWALQRAQPKGETIRREDLSRLSRLERMRIWTSVDHGDGFVWLEHAELIPHAYRASGAQKGRIASFVMEEKAKVEFSGDWHFVRVPSLSQLLRLENAVQTAWRSLTGRELPKLLASALANDRDRYDVEDLERCIVEAAPGGKEHLRRRLESRMEIGPVLSPWKKRKRLLEKALLEEALRKSGGNKTKAARSLGVHRNTVLWHLRKMREVKN
jgi:hypothetical protein